VWKGDLLTRLNRLPEAEDAYRIVTRDRPNYWLPHQQLGCTLDAMCRYKEALQSFRMASVAAPKNFLPISNIGAIQLKLGQYEDAQQNSEKSFKIKPDALTTLNLAQLFRSTARWPEALRMAEETVELDPSGDTGWLELGDCHSNAPNHSATSRQAAKQAYQRAQKEAETALQTDSSDGPKLMNLALYRLKTGTPDSILDAVAKAESAGALDPDSQLAKVRILELASKRDDAIATLAALFRKGVTTFQVDFVADLQALRRDPRYLAVSHQKRV
jgi:tetratricopeptide (TPR) repeat protein